MFSYVSDSDWVSVVKDKVGNLRYRYLYANGRPLRVDIPYVWWVNPYYFVYTARGDYAGYIDKPCCLVTVGTFSESMKWLTDRPVEVKEISCLNNGADACRYQIPKKLPEEA